MKKPNKTFSQEEVILLLKDAYKDAYKDLTSEIRGRDLYIRVLEKKIAELEEPPKKGRPKKKKSLRDLLLGKPPPKKGGAPIKYTNPRERISQWDQDRKDLAQKRGVRLDKVTDKVLAEHIVSNETGLSRDQKKEQTKVIRSFVKQMRDKTGIRISHRKRKQETP